MTPFPDLHTLPRQLRHPEVRDLAWVMLAPPMLAQTPWPQRHPLAGSDWVQAPHQLEAWLRQLDQDSSALQQWLSLARTRRLGLYYERLWQFAVQQAPGVELLAANLPIRRAGHTLGELDMLLRDRDGVHHLELAIKLYLGPQDGNGQDATQWLGPGCHDRLDRKLAHLAEHQLPISARAESREALAALDIQAFDAHLWLGGYLLYPWPGAAHSPSALTRSICVGAGCISATGQTLSAPARRAAGNPCPAMPGWRPRITRPMKCGVRCRCKVGWQTWTQWPRRSCWYAWCRTVRSGKKPSGCFWWPIFGRMYRGQADRCAV